MWAGLFPLLTVSSLCHTKEEVNKECGRGKTPMVSKEKEASGAPWKVFSLSGEENTNNFHAPLRLRPVYLWPEPLIGSWKDWMGSFFVPLLSVFYC